MSRKTRHQTRRRRHREPSFHRRTLPGAPPGILVPDTSAPRPVIQIMGYGPDGHEETTVTDVEAIRPFLARWPVTWVNVDGLGDTTVISDIGRLFNFHRLALEDVVHVHQRAKVDPYGTHYFVVGRMPHGDGDSEQVSLFLGDRYVVTFQEKPGGDCLEPVRVRIRTGMSHLHKAGPDCLLYSLLDAIIDRYFPIIEEAGDRLDDLESDVLDHGERLSMGRLHGIKRSLLAVRRAVWPLRDALNTLIRDQTPLIKDETRVYLRDCHDHTIQIIDLLESYRDIASGLHDVHLTLIGHRTNEIMRVLTVISTIFIPLTFVAGIYGMNFNHDASPLNMPELHWRWGYPTIMLAMSAAAMAMLVYFRRKGWLWAGNRDSEEHIDPPG